MFDYTVLWEGEDGEVYTYDFTAKDLRTAEKKVKVMAYESKLNEQENPRWDMWDACIEIQEHGKVGEW